MSTDYVDGFLRYDAFPQNSFQKRDLPVPRFGRPQEIRGGNSKLVKSIAWSCDGKRVATGTEFKGLRIWEVKPRNGTVHGVSADAGHSSALPSGKSPNPHNGHIAALAWSPTDPNILVSGCKSSSGGGVVAVWDVTKPTAPIASLKIAGDVLHIAFHPSGEHFAAVCPRSTRDEVFFFRQEGDTWVQRDDIMMGGAGIDIGVEEINSLRFWLGGDALMSVSNDGSLTSWWYPVDARPPLEEPPTKQDIDERPTKKSRIESPAAVTPAPDAEDAEGEAEREGSDGEGREAAEDEEGEKGEGKEKANGEPEEVNGEAGETPDGEADGDKAGVEIKIDGPDGDVEMGDASAPGTAAPSTAPSAPASAAPSVPASRQPTPPEDNSEALAAAAATAASELELAEKRAQAAAELAKRKHKQLDKCYRQTPHVASLLALAVDPLGRFLAIGGQDARVSLLSSTDWSVQRNFDAPTAAIRHAAFSADGELIAVGGDDNCVFVFSVFARTTIAKLPVTGSVNALVWCPTRNALAYSTNSKAGIVWYIAYQE